MTQTFSHGFPFPHSTSLEQQHRVQRSHSAFALGCDRDSGELVDLFDEDNPAVKTAVRLAIEGAHRHGRPPSRPLWPGAVRQARFCSLLVENGIESVSLTPDSVLTAIGVVAD